MATDAERDKLRSGIKAEDFRGIFTGAAQGVDRPFSDVQIGFFMESGAKELANSYVDRYLEKVGKLPDASQVEKFIGDNLDENFASGVINNTLPKSLILSRYVDPAIDSIAQKQKQEKDTATGNTILDKLYGTALERGASDIARVFGPQRQRALEEEATLGGRLRSGVSFSGASPAAQADERQGNALSELIGGLAQQRAGGEFSQSQLLSQLGQRESEFNRNQALQRQQMAEDTRRFNIADVREREAQRLSEILGQLQARRPKKGGIGKILGGGLSGGGAGALTGFAASGGNPLGALIGGLAGFGLGAGAGSQS